MKALLRILNLVYFILAGAAIACFTINFIKPDLIPFLRLGIDANLTEENSEEVISDDLLDEFNVSRSDLFAEGDIKVEVKVDITNMMMFNVWGASDGGTYIEDEFINPTIDSVVEQIEPAFTKVAKVAAKSSIKTMIENNLSQSLSGEGGLYQQLGEADPTLTPQQLSDDISAIIDEFSEEDATLDSVNEIYNDIYNKYSMALGNPEKSEAETKEELKNTLEQYNLVDEDGNITSIDDAIAALLGNMLNGDNNSSDEDDEDSEEPAAVALRRMLNPYYEEDGEGAAETEGSAIAEELKSFINDKVSGNDLVLGFKIAGIVWAVFVLGWAIKLLQCIICLFRKKPYIRVEIIGIIAGIAQVLLALISGLLLLAFKFGFITKLVGLPLIGGLIAGVPFLGSNGIGLELTFSAFVPGILVLVNLVYSIIYGFVKRSFKRSL